MVRRWRNALLVAAAFALGACAELLPKSQSELSSSWKSFDEAKAAIERIEPGRTTVAELGAAGIDPFTSPNIQLLNYSDIVLRFPMGWAGALEMLLVDGRAVYTIYGGQPNLREQSIARNPLGPLQGWGDYVRPDLVD